MYMGFTLGSMSNRRLVYLLLGAAALVLAGVTGVLDVVLTPVIDGLAVVTDGLETAGAAVTRFVESLDS